MHHQMWKWTNFATIICEAPLYLGAHALYSFETKDRLWLKTIIVKKTVLFCWCWQKPSPVISDSVIAPLGREQEKHSVATKWDVFPFMIDFCCKFRFLKYLSVCVMGYFKKYLQTAVKIIRREENLAGRINACSVNAVRRKKETYGSLWLAV